MLPNQFRHRSTIAILALLLCITGLPAQGQDAPEKGAAAQKKFTWAKYYDRTAGRPPRPVLIKALEMFEAEGREVRQAVDAGCGSGIETLFMLRAGIPVHAYDSSPDGIERLLNDVDESHRSLLRAEVATFHEATYDDDVDLVFAGFALPFSHPDHFDESWKKLVDSLAVGGRFAGQLFGDRDDWAKMPSRSHHTREQAEALLAGDFEIEVFEEIEEDRRAAAGRTKHWHYFDIIARKVRVSPAE